MKRVLLPSDKVSKSVMVRRHWPEGQECPVYFMLLLILIYVVKFETVKVRSRETKSRYVIPPKLEQSDKTLKVLEPLLSLRIA
jgi:hypothetical protein